MKILTGTLLLAMMAANGLAEDPAPTNQDGAQLTEEQIKAQELAMEQAKAAQELLDEAAKSQAESAAEALKKLGELQARQAEGKQQVQKVEQAQKQAEIAARQASANVKAATKLVSAANKQVAAANLGTDQAAKDSANSALTTAQTQYAAAVEVQKTADASLRQAELDRMTAKRAKAANEQMLAIADLQSRKEAADLALAQARIVQSAAQGKFDSATQSQIQTDAAAKQAALNTVAARAGVDFAAKSVTSANQGTDQAAKDAANSALSKAKEQLASSIAAQKLANAAAKQAISDAKSARKESDLAAKKTAELIKQADKADRKQSEALERQQNGQENNGKAIGQWHLMTPGTEAKCRLPDKTESGNPLRGRVAFWQADVAEGAIAGPIYVNANYGGLEVNSYSVSMFDNDVDSCRSATNQLHFLGQFQSNARGFGKFTNINQEIAQLSDIIGKFVAITDVNGIMGCCSVEAVEREEVNEVRLLQSMIDDAIQN